MKRLIENPEPPPRVSKRTKRDATAQEALELAQFKAIREAHVFGPLYGFLTKNLKEDGKNASSSRWNMLMAYVSGPNPKFNASIHEDVKKYVQEAESFVANEATNEQARANQLADYSPSPPADGEFRIMFMNVGSGDTIFFRTPSGHTIVVDCGTRARAYDDQVKHLRVALKEMLGEKTGPTGSTTKVANQTLHALILTHPDKDHYADVKSVLQGDVFAPGPVTQIMHVFHSLARADYDINGCKQFIDQRCVGGTLANQVDIRSDRVKLSNPSKYVIYDPVTANNKTTKGYIQILGKNQRLAKEPGWSEDKCEIYLLAAGIGGSSADKNAASIVTLIKVHGRKILLTGDAETETEAYLLERHADLIKDVDILHVEHHGSGTNKHATSEFVKHVNPRLAIISSGKLDDNPRWDLLQKLLRVKPSRLCKDVEPHLLDYSTGIDARVKSTDCDWSKSYKKYGIYSTMSSNDLVFSIDQTGVIKRTWTVKNKKYGYTLASNGAIADMPNTNGRASGI